MSAVATPLAAALSLSRAEFAALGRLCGAAPLLDGWMPEFSAAGWLAIIDGLAARGVLAASDGGEMYEITESAAPLVQPLVGADRAWSVVVARGSQVEARLVIGNADDLVVFEASSDGPSRLAEIGPDTLVPLGLAWLGLADVSGGGSLADPVVVSYDVLLPALGTATGPADAGPARGFVGAVAAAVGYSRVEMRAIVGDGLAVAACACIDGGEHGLWRTAPFLGTSPDGEGGGATVQALSPGHLRDVVEDILTPT